MNDEEAKGGKNKYKLYIFAAFIAIIMALSCVVIVATDSKDVAATVTTYNLDSEGAVTVYANEEAYNAHNGNDMTLREALTGQADGQYWVFKAGNYNVTKNIGDNENPIYNSAMVILTTVTMIGAVDDGGEAATTLYADYANGGTTNWTIGGATNNELIACKAKDKTVTIENMNLMPMVYIVKDSKDPLNHTSKYGPNHEEIPGFRDLVSEEEYWYTPNCLMTYSCNLTMKNVNIQANTLGRHLVNDGYNVYMLDDGGNCQNYDMKDGTYTTESRMTVIFDDVTSCGGFSFNKQYANISFNNVRVKVGGDNTGDGQSEIGDQRMLKLISNPASPSLKANFTKMTNVVFDVEPCTVRHDAVHGNDVTIGHNLATNTDATNLLAIMLSDAAEAAFPANADVTINLNTDSVIAYDTAIPAGFTVVNNGAMTVAAGKTLTTNGTINVNGSMVNNGTMDGTGHVLVPVTFNKNSESATGTMPIQNVDFGVATPLEANAFTITGYKITGWAESATGEVVYADGANVTLTAGKTLYAKWAPISYSIAFDANSGTGTTAAVAATYDENATLTAVGFTRADYVFGGWATSASGDAVFSDKAVVKNLSATDGATITLYAKWIQIEKTDNAAVVTVTTDAVSDQAAEQLVEAAKQMKDAGTENVSVDVKATETEAVSIKSDSVKDAVDSGIGVNIATSKGAMEFSSEALAGLIEDGKTLKSEIKEIEVPPAYAEKIPADAKVFSISLTSNDVAITSFGATFTVRVAYEASGNTDNLYVGYLADDGTIQKMDSYYKDGFMVFTTDHLSDYAILEGSSSSSGDNQGLLLAVLLIAAIVLPIIAALIIFKKE